MAVIVTFGLLVLGAGSRGFITSHYSPQPPKDVDKDGWSDVAEAWIGTDPKDACSGTKKGGSSDAWPPDLNNDKAVNVIDIGLVVSQFGHSGPAGSEVCRYDLNAAGLYPSRDSAGTVSIPSLIPSAHASHVASPTPSCTVDIIDIGIVVDWFGSVCKN